MAKMKMGAKAKHPIKTLIRVLKEVFGKLMAQIVFIILCNLATAFVTVYSANFLGSFIDSFVSPLIGVSDPDWRPAIVALMKYAGVVSISILCNFLMSYLMVSISQGSIYNIRIGMFKKLESLPLSFFDTNSHGSLMSRFSNDTDTLNQLISNGLIQLISAFVTTIWVFISMFANSWKLTIIDIVFIFIMLNTTSAVARKSGTNYAKQQKDIA